MDGRLFVGLALENTRGGLFGFLHCIAFMTDQLRFGSSSKRRMHYVRASKSNCLAFMMKCDLAFPLIIFGQLLRSRTDWQYITSHNDEIMNFTYFPTQ